MRLLITTYLVLSCFISMGNDEVQSSCHLAYKGISTDLVHAKLRSMFNNFTIIRDGSTYSKKSQLISPKFFNTQRTSISQGIHGDKVTVQAYVDESNNKLLKSPEGYQEIKPKATNQQLSTARSSIGENEALLNYVQKTSNSQGNLSKETVDFLVESFSGDREMIAKAYEFMVIQNMESTVNKTIELSTEGENSFFWFIPKDFPDYVPAKIIDIHPYLSPVKNSSACSRNSTCKDGPNDQFVFLVEYLKANDNGEKISHIAELNSNEFETIRRDATYSSSKADQAFTDELNPLEYSAINLAKNVLRLKTFGFSEKTRGLRDYSSDLKTLHSLTPLATMKNDSALYIKISIEKYIKSTDYLRLESDPENINVLDLFSRLDPKYVIDNFYHPDFEYTWIIDERGTLKVAPKTLKSTTNNIQPHLLRLSSGRKIYVGGHFTINRDGSLNIDYGRGLYGRSADGIRPPGAFKSSYELKDFIHTVFYQQAEAVGDFYIMDFRHDLNKNYAQFITTPQSTKTIENMKKVDWDPKTDNKPLKFNEWAAKSFMHEKLEWAYYVLRVHSKMKFKEIKKAFKSLAKDFHPDKLQAKNPDKEVDPEPMQIIQEAYEMIEKTMNLNSTKE